MFMIEAIDENRSPASPNGAVLGVDVGWSEVRRSSAACLLRWDHRHVVWQLCRFTARPRDRLSSLAALVAGHSCMAAAIDGPLARDLPEIGRYRAAERVLTRAFAVTIGKPGQSNSPNGRLLNRGANRTAATLQMLACVGPASHRCAILETAIVEAFPTAFMGVMLRADETTSQERHQRSDIYYRWLTEGEPCRLAGLLRRLLPGREAAAELSTIRNHDERAAIVCALTALSVAVGHYCAVGDEPDGWIILPPKVDRSSPFGLQPWAEQELQQQTMQGMTEGTSLPRSGAMLPRP